MPQFTDRSAPLPTDVSLPTPLRTHPLVQGKWLYVVPTPVWNALDRSLGPNWLSKEQRDFERAISTAADAIGGCVAFQNGLPVADWLLCSIPSLNRRSPMVAGYFRDVEQAGYSIAGLETLLGARSQTLQLPRRGYLGWLFTNPSFLTEWDTVQRQIGMGIESPPQPVAAIQAQLGTGSGAPLFQADRDPVTRLVQAFCCRWRLARVVGPATAEPLSVQFPVPLPSLGAAHSQDSGSLLYIPDIAPLPDRDELRQILEDAVRQTGNAAPHLSEWMELIRSDTQGKKTIATYALWYPLQHYLRVLHSRHAAALVGHFTVVKAAIAAYLKITPENAHKHVLGINRRLGVEWYQPRSVSN